MAENNIVLAFDAYGTLLSTESIAQKLAEHFGQEKATTIATEWRKYQLEYTWRLNSMNKYEPFTDVTRKSLQHAIFEADVTLTDSQIQDLMTAYNSLHVFPDVPPLFTHLRQSPQYHPVVFSNGTAAMINTSLTQSPDLSPHAGLFRQVVVVEPVERFKPDPLVYQHLCEKVGKKGDEGSVWLVSGNPFDVVGANAVGLRTCWVDRGGRGWGDRLAGGPTVVVSGLDRVLETVGAFLEGLK
ncbi:haloacid dehalogenase, type II [Massarina eburnea CBS 473.64]|uniref:Haloacid dehalogenase, type II n=1 Tax=Massarina eburnea CBS 473.64 TaxID=1395130 RepID=A0A6A6RI34_9PLEO|nr:haloacid dehalogenase, type II [Massarina eburnea CBS 473.64]